MKVINQGDPRGPKPSWVGTTISCGCGFSAELDMEDVARVEMKSDQRDGNWIEIACPTCGRRIVRDVK